jgi:ribosomal protein S27E
MLRAPSAAATTCGPSRFADSVLCSLFADVVVFPTGGVIGVELEVVEASV